MPSDKQRGHEDSNDKKSVHSTPISTLIGQYQNIAVQLQQSEDLEEVEEILSSITNESTATQVEFLKALSNEHTSAAADIAQALNTLSENKEVRKEARRSLVQLEKEDIYAQWQPPTGPTISQALEQITSQSNESGNSLISDLQSLLAGAEDFFAGSAYSDTVSDFLDEWAEGNYEEVYDLLASESPLREKLEQADWVERRSQWNLEAHTGRLQISFIEPLADEEGQSLPIVDVGWSIELNEDAPVVALAELPQATAALLETGRHWFWTRYTLVQEDEEWLIGDMTDIGASILQSPLPEIQEHIERLEAEAQELIQEVEGDEDDDEEFDEDEDDEDDDEEDDDADLIDLMQTTSGAIRLSTQIMYYFDALISKTQDVEAEIYRRLAEQALTTNETERAAYYAQQLAAHVPEARGEALNNLAIIYLAIAEQSHENDDHEREHHLSELAEKTLRDAIESDHNPKSMILLANILLQQDDHLDEAETLLHNAEGSTNSEDDTVAIELGLGEIAFSRDQKEHALAHYQNAARLNDDDAELWYRIGYLQSQLDNHAQAVSALQKCIQLEPTYAEAYTELAGSYLAQNDAKRAREVIREGLEINPDSADLLASLSLVYLQSNDARSAKKYLEQAEAIDSSLEFVQEARRVYNLAAPKDSGSKNSSKSNRGGNNKQKHNKSKKR